LKKKNNHNNLQFSDQKNILKPKISKFNIKMSSLFFYVDYLHYNFNMTIVESSKNIQKPLKQGKNASLNSQPFDRRTPLN